MTISTPSILQGFDVAYVLGLTNTSLETLRRIFLRILVGSSVVIPFVYVAIPGLRKVLVRENNFLELFTALCYVSVLIYGWRLCYRLPKKGKVRWYWLIPVLGLLGFLEEESFGHSFLYFSVPQIRGVQVDSLHDLLLVGLGWVTAWDVFGQILAGSMILGGMCYLGFRLFLSWSPISKYLEEHPPLWFVSVCGILLSIAVILDLEMYTFRGLHLIEELLEAQASIALFFSCLSLKGVLDRELSEV